MEIVAISKLGASSRLHRNIDNEASDVPAMWMQYRPPHPCRPSCETSKVLAGVDMPVIDSVYRRRTREYDLESICTSYRGRTQTMSEISWQRDGIDPGLFIAEGVGSIRSTASYGKPGGWWFLPAWLPDTGENDIGPFKTKTAALKEAQRLSAAKDVAAQK